MAAPALLPVRHTFQLRRRQPPRHWGALVGGIVLTTLLTWLLGTALFDRRMLSWGLGEATATRPPEAITYVDVAPPQLPEPAPAAVAPAAPGLPSTAAPALPTTPSIPAPRTRSGLPPIAPPRDTAGAAGAPGRAAPPPRVPPAALPDGPVWPTMPPRVESAPTATCAAPCSGGLSSGARVPVPPLDSAARAERLRELGESVPALARKRPRGDVMAAPSAPSDPTRPQPAGGVSIPIPLPGGGPSAAERKRNRELDAQISASLERVRARLDSLRADSVRRADSLRKAKEKPPEH